MHDYHYFSDEASTIYLPHLLAMPPHTALDLFPHVPTMIGTRLQLELLFQESLIDLSAVTEVILSDAGATLQILRLIGEEYPQEEDRPTRIEDCIASLNMEHCYNAVCASSTPHNSDIMKQWQHFRRVAQCARELAKCIDGVSPEQAYLVGLLYEVGKLPRLLGWKDDTDSSRELKALAVMLADYWRLPAYLLAAIREQQEAVVSSRWSEILQMAECAVDQVEAGITE